MAVEMAVAGLQVTAPDGTDLGLNTVVVQGGQLVVRPRTGRPPIVQAATTAAVRRVGKRDWQIDTEAGTYLAHRKGCNCGG